MTTAVCYKCGEFKHGAFKRCQKCGASPVSEDDYALSMSMTDHYFDLDGLKAMGLGVKNGNPPHHSPETREMLLKEIRSYPEFISAMNLQKTKPWWKVW